MSSASLKLVEADELPGKRAGLASPWWQVKDLDLKSGENSTFTAALRGVSREL